MSYERTGHALSVLVLLSLGCPRRPEPPRFTLASAPLLAWVPEDASGVLVVRQLDPAGVQASVVGAIGPHASTLMAWVVASDGGVVARSRGTGPRPIALATDLPAGDATRALAQLEAIRTTWRELELAPVGRVADRPLVVASPRWAAQVRAGSSRAPVLAALQRAPANAAVIAAYVSSPDVGAWPISTTVGWAVVDPDRVTIDGALDLRGPLAPSVALGAVFARWASHAANTPAPCWAALERVAARFQVAQRRAQIVFHAEIPRADVAALGVCGASDRDARVAGP